VSVSTFQTNWHTLKQDGKDYSFEVFLWSFDYRST
jgi:hypothetical protein